MMFIKKAFSGFFASILYQTQFEINVASSASHCVSASYIIVKYIKPLFFIQSLTGDTLNYYYNYNYYNL